MSPTDSADFFANFLGERRFGAAPTSENDGKRGILVDTHLRARNSRDHWQSRISKLLRKVVMLLTPMPRVICLKLGVCTVREEKPLQVGDMAFHLGAFFGATCGRRDN